MFLRFLCLLVMILSSTSLFAGIEQYFKLPTQKQGSHRMKNIDFIYMINLDERPEKYASCAEKLKPYGIHPYRFSAVNGWKLPLSIVNDVAITWEPSMEGEKPLWGTTYELGEEPFHEIMHVRGRKYFSHCMSRGAVAICLSHLSVLQDALNSGYKTIWVMEDDVEVIRNPNLMSDLIEKLNRHVGTHGWDILFTDQDTKNQKGEYVPCLGYARRPNFSPHNPARFAERKDISPEFRKVGARYGAYSMIVKKSGMKKILNFLKKYKIFLPYDMEFYLPDDIRMYAVIHDVVSTEPNALSDNGAPRYKVINQ